MRTALFPCSLLIAALFCCGCKPQAQASAKNKGASPAEVAYARGDYQTSAGLFHDQAGQGSQKHEAYYYEGMSYLNSGRYAEAIPCFDSAARFGATDQQRARALVAKGRALIRTGDGAGAVKAFSTVLKSYREHYPEAEVLCGLQMAQTMAGDAEGAEKTRAELREKHPQSRCPGLRAPGIANETPSTANTNENGVKKLYRVRLTQRFSDSAGAQAAASGLKEQGIEAAVVALPGGQGYAVQAGAFSSAAGAQKRAQMVQAAGQAAEVNQ